MDENASFRKFDVTAFARHNGHAGNSIALDQLPRLAAEIANGDEAKNTLVEWKISGEMRFDAQARPSPWLLCEASVFLPLQCQSCLDPLEMELTTRQWFRFVPTEEQAEQEDEHSEEDVLALTGPIDIFQLIEDDLLMALPFAATHSTCGATATGQAKDPLSNPAGTARPKPFSSLKGMTTGHSEPGDAPRGALPGDHSSTG